MELDREFRVLGQTLSMHTTLRDRYARRALTVDLLLLACSVVFCASAFASDAALSHFRATPDQVRLVLRAFSVLAFMLSILSLRIDWKGRSACHGAAASRMSSAVASFSKHRGIDGAWPPESSFVKLKARHLRKVELSRMLSLNPGCPVLVLRARLFFSSMKGSLGRNK